MPFNLTEPPPGARADVALLTPPFTPVHILPPRMRKLMYRVVFPFELKLPNTTDDAQGGDALYSLFAVVVHVGSGPHHGACAAPPHLLLRCTTTLGNGSLGLNFKF